jgi:N-methylhydantoinase B
VRIVRGGQIDREMLDLILLNVRTPQEREGDLESQIGACRVGEQRILQLAEKYGAQRLQSLIEELLDYSERLVRAELRRCPPALLAEDWLDDDGVTDTPVKIARASRSTPPGRPFTSISPAPRRRLRAASTPSAPSRSPPASTSCAACSRGCAGNRRHSAPAHLITPQGSIVDALPPPRRRRQR